VPVVSFTFGLPSAQVLASLRAVGTTVVQTVTTPAEAVQAAQLGVDALVVQSISAGGHSGTFTPQAPASDVPRADLVDDVASAVALPIWAAGGIATSDHVDEVLRTRAEAAVVGTVLLRCVESGASPAYRKALRQWTDRQTVRTTAFSGRPARALANAFTEQFGPLAPLGYPAVHHLTSPLRRAAAAANDAEHINVWAGTGHRHGTDEPAAVILRRLAGAPPA
jgi:nitronate monooxygenase